MIKKTTRFISLLDNQTKKKLLLNKFKNFKFMQLEKSLIRYFDWIKELPINANLKKFHPLERKRNRK